MENPGNRVMYYLKDDGPERAFLSEELMLIPEDTDQSSDILQHSQNRPTGDRWLKSRS